MGSYGIVPEAKIRRVGRDTTVLEFNEMESGQGEECRGVELISTDDKPRLLLQFPTEANNHGACGGPHTQACFEWTNTPQFDVSKDGYGMITLTKKGRELLSYRKTKRVNTKPVKYCYQGGQYSICK